jgi:hypothetical protein
MVLKKYMIGCCLFNSLRWNDNTCVELLSNTLLAHHLALQIHQFNLILKLQLDNINEYNCKITLHYLHSNRSLNVTLIV